MERKTLKLEMIPQWHFIEQARNQCEAFLASLNYPTEVRESLTMITSEFLENAVKYGAFRDGRDTIPLAIEASNEGILMEVRSPLDSSQTQANIRRLDAMVQWIRSFQSPFQAYLERLKLVSGQPLDDEESGLGLVRVAYEGEAIIDFYVDENDTLSISALFPCTPVPEAKI